MKRTIGAGFSGTYFQGQAPRDHGRGLPAGPGLRRRLPARRAGAVAAPTSSGATPSTSRTGRRPPWRSSGGLVYRIASGRVHLAVPAGERPGVLVNNQSPLLARRRDQQRRRAASSTTTTRRGTRLRPAFALGVGTTIAAGTGYQLRWEVRDNIVGIQRSPAPSGRGAVPPHETGYKHIFSLNVGLDVILERGAGDATDRRPRPRRGPGRAAGPPGSAAGRRGWRRSAASGSWTGWWTR